MLLVRGHSLLCILLHIFLVRTVNISNVHFPAPLPVAQNPDLGLLAAILILPDLLLRLPDLLLFELG